MYTLLYLKWITNKDLLCSTWNSTQYYVAAWMGVGGVLGKTDTGIYTPVFLSCSPETSLNQPYPNTKYKFKRFHIYTLIYNTFLSLSDLLHSV